MTSKESQRLLLERVGTDNEFFRSLGKPDSGGETDDQCGGGDGGEDDGDEKMVYYDDIDTSKTINEAVQDIIGSVSAGCLVDDVHADKEDNSDESDAEDRGTGANLDIYIKSNFLVKDATKKWMEWDGE